MSSTILFALSGEQVLYKSSLATVTNNWVLVGCGGSSQALISIATLSSFRTLKRTDNLVYPAFAAGSLLVAVASLFSKEPASAGASWPFFLVSLALLAAAQATRQASIAFVVDADVVQTRFGNLREVATVVAVIRSAQSGNRREQPPYYSFSWVRVYIALLVSCPI